MRKLLVGLIFSATIVASPAQAVEQTYKFSGVLNNSYQFNAPIPEWQFAAGQRFTGTLVYDAAAVSSGYDAINTPEWRLSFHSSPIVALSFQIETPGTAYSYVVPTLGLTGTAWTYAAIGKVESGLGGWSGVDIRTQNYPVGWKANPPSVAVPPSAYVGPFNPHSVGLSLIDSLYYNPNAATLLANTSADQDLASLFLKLQGPYDNFSVRFSNSMLWEPGVERLDGVIGGRFDSFTLLSGVPEPSSWVMMIAGFGVVGFGLRKKRAAVASA